MEIIRKWMEDGRPALIAGTRLRPCGHPMLMGIPMSVQRGQATVVFMRSDDGRQWLIKKFHSGRQPDGDYLRGVARVLPHHSAFQSGNARVVLDGNAVELRTGCFDDESLRIWIQNCVLIPRQPGVDWAGVADSIRDGDMVLNLEQKVKLCRQLAEHTGLLESANCSHRDLSCGNAFVDAVNWKVSLIDFDSLFHPSLCMPLGTAAGTEGYTAPFTWNHGGPEPRRSWCPHSDRFALSLLNVEFLLMEAGAPLAADGGLFAQEDLCRRSSRTIDMALELLQKSFAGADRLFEKAIHSHRFDDCPAPADWVRWCNSFAVGPKVTAELSSSQVNIRAILQRRIRPEKQNSNASRCTAIGASGTFGWTKILKG